MSEIKKELDFVNTPTVPKSSKPHKKENNDFFSGSSSVAHIDSTVSCKQDGQQRWGWRSSDSNPPNKFFDKATSRCIPTGFYSQDNDVQLYQLRPSHCGRQCRVVNQSTINEKCSSGVTEVNDDQEEAAADRAFVKLGPDYGVAVTQQRTLEFFGNYMSVGNGMMIKKKGVWSYDPNADLSITQKNPELFFRRNMKDVSISDYHMCAMTSSSSGCDTTSASSHVFRQCTNVKCIGDNTYHQLSEAPWVLLDPEVQDPEKAKQEQVTLRSDARFQYLMADTTELGANSTSFLDSVLNRLLGCRRRYVH